MNVYNAHPGFALAVVSCLVVGLVACGSGGGAERLAEGKKIYEANCKVCHAQSINGAPILGNKKMWSKRAEQGEDTLVAHAISGFGLMVPKGGNAQLTDEEIRSVVKYMLSTLEQ